MLYIFYILLNFLDFLVTSWLIDYHCCNIESNPLAAWIYQEIGIWAMFLYKAFFTALVVGIADYVHKKNKLYSHFVLVFGCVTMIFTVAYSLYLCFLF